MFRLLVVDDEPNVLYSMQETLSSDDLEVITAQTAKIGIELVLRESPDAVILDVRLPDMSGLEAYDAIRRINPLLPVIMITAYSTTETAIEAIKRGAFEYLLKPVELQQLREVTAKALEMNHRNRRGGGVEEPSRAEGDATEHILGRSPAMQEVYKVIGRVAPQDLTVLILGESGTGKELVARAIYEHSQRSDAPFLAINCAAIPESLLESELFGHEKGAFTGADRRRIGKFEQATGGTIFLDEIGDMALPTQAKMLRLLQEQSFERIGSNELVRTNVRVIAATNQDLGELVAAGRFRQDLYYRLNVVSIHLPPLRERVEDLPILTEHFIRRFNLQLSKRVRSLPPETMRVLQHHSWPGNVRELQNAIKYALLNARGETITPDVLPEHLRATNGVSVQAARSAESEVLDIVALVRALLQSDKPAVYDQIISAVDRVVLREVLNHVRGNQVAAAERLGLSRNTLRAKLRTLGLSVEKQVTPDFVHRER